MLASSSDLHVQIVVFCFRDSGPCHKVNHDQILCFENDSMDTEDISLQWQHNCNQ